MTANMHTSDARTCENCGEPLHGKRTKRHCDGKCRTEARRSRRRAEADALVQTLTNGIRQLADLAKE